MFVFVQYSATSSGRSKMTSTNHLYFIVTEKPEFPSHISAGRICYISKSKHRLETEHRTSHSPTKLPVIFLGSNTALPYDLEVSIMEELSEEEAELLQALHDDAERLKLFREREALQAAMQLTEGAAVTVEEGGQKLRGIIRYVGRLKEPKYSCPLSGRFFGIELQVGL